MFIPSHFVCFVLWCSLSDNMQVVFVETGTLPHTCWKCKTHCQTSITMIKDCMTSESHCLASIELPDLKIAKKVSLYTGNHKAHLTQGVHICSQPS